MIITCEPKNGKNIPSSINWQQQEHIITDNVSTPANMKYLWLLHYQVTSTIIDVYIAYSLPSVICFNTVHATDWMWSWLWSVQ